MSLWLDHIEKKLTQSSNYIEEVESGRRCYYSDLILRSRLISNQLVSHEQKNITVILPNSISYIEILLATLKSRNVFNPLPYFMSTGEMEAILDYVEPSVVITDREDIKQRFSYRFNILSPADFQFLTTLRSARKIRESDIACLYYSSGTTGNPKGILYSYANIFHLINSICAGFKFTGRTKHLSFLPFGHTAAINYNIFPCLFTGAPLYISSGFENLRASFFQTIEKYKINYTQLVPTVLLMLLKLKYKVSDLDLSSLEFIGCGSSLLPLEVQKRFFDMYNIRVANLYGLSETGPSHIDNPREKNWVPGSIGRPLKVNACKVNKQGEILLKGKNVFVGYYQNKKQYRKVVKKGWFCTGDLGEKKGAVYFFKGRKKDLIIKSGINIAPEEIEEIIYKYKYVKECIVVGIPDDVHGEEIAAVAVKKHPIPTGAFIMELQHICKNYLSNFKVPKYIKVAETLPKTHSGKLLRRKAYEQFF